MDDASALTGQFCQNVAMDLRLLADIHATELTQEHYSTLCDIRFPEMLALENDDEVYQLVQQQLRVLLHDWPEQLPDSVLDELATDYAAIYLNGNLHAYPSESVWLDDEQLICQQPMFQVREWYERYGMAVPNWRQMSDDHLVNELLFTAHLLEQATTKREEIQEVARFMDEHLLRWLLPFGRRVSQRCNTPFYASLALLTGLYAERVRDVLAVILGEPRPDAETIERRMKAPPPAAQPQTLQYYPGAAASW